jgi:hypothetical protein
MTVSVKKDKKGEEKMRQRDAAVIVEPKFGNGRGKISYEKMTRFKRPFFLFPALF